MLRCLTVLLFGSLGFWGQGLHAQTTANDDFATLVEDGFVNVPVLINDAVFGPPPLTVAIELGPSNGAATVVLSASITYQPDPDFAGTDSIRYRLCDGAEPIPSCDQAWVILTVTPVNDAPIARNDTLDVVAGFPAALPVLDNDLDVDSDPLTVSVLAAPMHGTAAPTPGADSIYYVPDAGYLGPDSIRYRICDPAGLCADATVLIEVVIGNLPPIARPDTLVTIVNYPRRIDVLANDTDPEGAGFAPISIVALPSFGTAAVGLGGEINYAPAAEFIGLDSFRYEVCDLDVFSRCDRAKVFVQVNELRVPDSFSPNGDGINDRFVILGVEAYPDNRLLIHDRRGEPVFTRDGYANEWDGRDEREGFDLPEDVYFYRFRINGLNAAFAGSITLRR